MEIFQAILLGIIEGLTEFLPISSTGHLIVATDALNYYDASKLFTVFVQLGAIAAVIWFYRRDLFKLLKGVVSGNTQARRFFMVWILATIPAGVFGILFDARIEAYAFTSTVAWALIIGGVVIWLIETYYKTTPSTTPKLDTITVKQAVSVGLYQVIALIPGVSRSGATILGGMVSGLDRVTATAFSFYLSIPVLVLAGFFKLFTEDISTVEGGYGALAAGLVASFITALLVIRWLLHYVGRHDFKPFAYYRIVFGVMLLLLVWLGYLG